jgi:imidazolonepropionase-like amidohydrolase
MRIQGIEIFDGEDAIGVSDIVLAGGAVESVRTASSSAESELSMIPGLIDTHVHLVGNASSGTADFYTWPLTTTREEQVLHGLAHAQQALRAGVTTVRDLAADDVQVAISRAVEKGIVDAARVVTHGFVGMTAGHYDLFTPATITDRPATADGPDACRQLVRLHARNGLDGIKIATSGGVLSMGDRTSWRNYTDAEIAAIVDEAHALGMLVAAHSHTDDGITIALAHGVDSLEHATLIGPRNADEAARAGVTIAPTLLINEAIAAGAVPVHADAREKAFDLLPRRDASFADAVQRGVRFVLGTDCNGYHVKFGDQMLELARMAEVLGLAASDVVRAATSWAADAIGRGNDLGRLREGYAADALIMRGRPWERHDDLRVDNIVAVIARGRVVHGSLPPAVCG